MANRDYKTLPMQPEAYGEQIKVALCDSFTQAMQAQKDGCDVALVHSEETVTIANALSAQPSRSNTVGDFAKYINENFFKDTGLNLFKNRFSIFGGAGSRVHSDTSPTKSLFGLAEKFLIMPENIPTIIYTKKTRVKLIDGRLEHVFRTAPKQDTPLCDVKSDSCIESGCFSPIAGTCIVLFNDVAHSGPKTEHARWVYTQSIRSSSLVSKTLSKLGF